MLTVKNLGETDSHLPISFPYASSAILIVSSPRNQAKPILISVSYNVNLHIKSLQIWHYA